MPTISLSAGLNLDSKQQFQTQFVLTNTGHAAVYDVQFSCSLIGPALYAKKIVPDLAMPRPVQVIRSGDSVSRGCFVESLVEGPMLKVDARFRWPVIRLPGKVTAYFSVRSGPAGSFFGA